MRLLAFFLLLGCLGGGACVSAPHAAGTDAAADADGQATLRRIRAAIGAAPCSAASECRTLALGAKSCGGPEFYVAWSGAPALARELDALALRYRERRVALNAASDAVSDCRLVEDPGAVCRPGANGAPGVCVPASPAQSGVPGAPGGADPHSRISIHSTPVL